MPYTHADVATPQPNWVPYDSDAHLEVWDVRRHYTAKYALSSSDGAAVDALWEEDDATLVVAFQNGALTHIDLGDASLPLQDIPRQLVASCLDEMAYGLDHFDAHEIPFE